VKVIVCTAMGGNISPEFFVNWSIFLHWTDQKETSEKYQFSWRYFGGSDVYVARNACLRGLTRGDPRMEGKVLPWQGKVEYDKILWIDTDTVFDIKDVERILSHDVDIVSGCVKVNLTEFGIQRLLESPYGGHIFATIRDVAKNPETGEMVDTFALWIKECKQENGLCEIDACGGAFLAVKKGVYETMGFPWYRTMDPSFDGFQIFMSEDIGWSHRAKEMGFKVWADPEVRPGHEKALVLR
jgi:hypothetical protein